MKTKIKRHSRSVISVLLAVCMLVSCMTVGLIATDAAKVTNNDPVAASVNNSSSVGAEATATVYYGIEPRVLGSGKVFLNSNSNYSSADHWNHVEGTSTGNYYNGYQIFSSSDHRYDTTVGFTKFEFHYGANADDWSNKWVAFSSNTTEWDYLYLIKGTTGSKLTTTYAAATMGWDQSATYKIKNNFTGKWGDSAQTMLTDGADASIKYYDFYGTKSDFTTDDSQFRFRFNGSGDNVGCDVLPNTAKTDAATASTNIHRADGSTYKDQYWKYDIATPMSSDTAYYRLRVTFDLDANNGRGSVLASATVVPNMDPTFSTTRFTVGSTYNLTTLATVTEGSNAGTVAYSGYKYYDTSDTLWHDIGTPSSWTPDSTTITKLKVTAADGGIVIADGATQNAKSARSSQSNETSITVIPKLPTPSLSNVAVDDYTMVSNPTSGGTAPTTVTLTDSSYDDIVAALPSGVTFSYALYKGGDLLTEGSGNDYIDNGDGTFTLPAVTASAGSYTLKAVSSDDTAIADSSTSSAATLTVYSPTYSLSGNVSGDYIVGSTETRPTGDDAIIDGQWWAYYHDALAVKTYTGTPGKYRLEFKTQDEATLMDNNHTQINVGVASKPGSGNIGTQYAFVIDNVYYNYINANKDGDYKVPEEGITTENAYLCGLHSENGGGSLVLKPNTTYVFEIDQTQRKDASHPWGKLKLYSNSYNVTTHAKARVFDSQAGAYEPLADATSAHGVATATPSRVDKNNTSLLTATPASGYTFEGWYTDAACTTAATGLTAQSANTWTTPSILAAKTYYAKFEQVQPAQVAITATATEGGSVTVSDDGTQSSGTLAYVGANISLTADNNSGYKLSHWIVNGKRVEMNGYSLTDIPVTGDMNIEAVFVSTTPTDTKQKVKVRVNDTDYGTAVAKVGDDVVTEAHESVTVKIVLTPDQDAALQSITATDSHGDNVALTVNPTNANVYTFTMGDDDVTVNVNYTDYVGEANYWLDTYSGDPLLDSEQFSTGKYNGNEYAYYYVSSGSAEEFTVKDAVDATADFPKIYLNVTNNDSNSAWLGDMKIQYWVNNAWTTAVNMPHYAGSNNDHYKKFKTNSPVPDGATKVKFVTNSDSTQYKEYTFTENLKCAFDIYQSNGIQIRTWSADDATDVYVYSSTPTPVSEGKLYKWSDGVYGNSTADGTHVFGSTLSLYQYSNTGHAHTTVNKNFYVIVYYPGVDYGTINGDSSCNNSTAHPIIVASETLPGQKPPVKPVDVYAKDGYIRDGYQVQSEAATTTITKIVAPDGTVIFESAATDAATGTTAHGPAGTTVSAANDLITTLGAGITYTPKKEGKGDPGTWYEKVTSIPKGSTVSVRTVLANDKDMFAKSNPAAGKSFRDTHYVRGYVCNGVTYALHNYDDSGIYTEDITIPTDTKINNFEITPVYYMNDASNCKTFVIQGFDESIQKLGWGNTLYAYPYYNGVDRMQCAFGGYPGTALLCYGGTYMIQIPVTNDGTADGAEIRGLTLSNGYWDLLHRAVDSAELNDHRQTYDYDDFYKIYKEKSPDNIYVSFKYRNVKNNLVTGQGPHNGDANDNATATRSDFEANGNGIEDYLDALNRPIDIFGNVLSSTDLANAKADNKDKRMLIVSDGYAQTYTGEYATDWTIFYTENGGANYSRVTTVAPSVLYMNNLLSWNKPYTSASDTTTVGKLGWYKERYEDLQDYMHIPVEITYEQEIKNNFSDIANRLDARWLYSNNSDKINAKIKIEYLPLHASKYIEDTFVDPADPASITGSVTGTKAYFTNYTPKNINKKTQASDFVINPEGTFDFMAEEASGYEFVGWYVQYDGHDGENKVNKEGSLDGHSPIIANATYVARFKAVQSGSLNVSHTVKKDDDHKGDGTPYIFYTIKNDKGTVVESSVTFKNSTAFNFKNSAYIKSKYENYTIDVYLDAVPKAGSTFAGYIQPSFPDPVSSEKFNLTTSNVTSPIASTWAGTNLAHAQFTVADVLENDAFSSIAYFSQFTLNETKTYKYEITYTFPSRFWGNQQYKVTGNLDEGEVEAFVTGSGTGASLNQTFLVQNTPYESDFHKVLSWKYDEADQSCEDVGTSTDHVYMITAEVECEAVPDNKVNAEFVFPFGGTVSGPLTNPEEGDNTDKVVFDPDAKSVNYSTDFLCLFQTDNSSLFFDDTGEIVKYVWNDNHLVVDEVNGHTLKELAAAECTNPNCVDSKTGQHMCHPTITVNEETVPNPKWLSYYWSRHIRPTIDLLEAPDNIYKLKDSKNDFAN